MFFASKDEGDLLDHARQVARRLDVLTDAKVSGSLLEQRVLCGVKSAPFLAHSAHSVASRRCEGTTTYLCSLLGSPGLPLRERRRRGLLSFRWLSLRKEKYQHNCSDHTFLLTLRRLIEENNPQPVSSPTTREDRGRSRCAPRSQSRVQSLHF